MRIAVAVLTGGQSTRMGRDKALLAVDGVALALRSARTVRACGADPVVCVGGDAGALAALGLAVISDGRPGTGPLGAVGTALDWAAQVGAEALLVVACDHPQLSAAALAEVLAALRPGIDAAVPRSEHGLEPLHAAYRVATVGPVIAAALDDGERRLWRALTGGPLRLVHPVLSDPASLRDADRPEDLDRSP